MGTQSLGAGKTFCDSSECQRRRNTNFFCLRSCVRGLIKGTMVENAPFCATFKGVSCM